MSAWSRDWTTLLPLSKAISTFPFQLGRFLKQYLLYSTRYRICKYQNFSAVGSFC